MTYSTVSPTKTSVLFTVLVITKSTAGLTVMFVPFVVLVVFSLEVATATFLNVPLVVRFT